MTKLPDEPGTIFAMLGDAEISKLVTWCSDGLYSHIGVVVDDGDFVEATTAGVRALPLSDRSETIRTQVRYAAWSARNDDGSPLAAAQLKALSNAARAHVGRPYDTGVLVQLGMVVLVKRRVPRERLAGPARALIIAALAHLVRGRRDAFTCSELVYRAFAEAQAIPPLRPHLPEPPRLHQPFPDIDWAQFACEVAEIYRPGAVPDECRDALTGVGSAAPTAEAVLERIDEVAEALGLLAGSPTPATAGLPPPQPNPKAVQLPELTASPRFIERMAHPPHP